MKQRRNSQRGIPHMLATAAIAMFAASWPGTPVTAQGARAPEPVGSVPAHAIVAGQAASLDLSPYFSDPDGDPLAFAATVSDAEVATVAVSGNMLTMTGVAPGMAVLTVFASDPGGLSATQRTQVTVEVPNRGPEPVGTIPGQTLAAGQWVSIGLSSYFRDPEGETLSFAATTSDAAVATVAVAGEIVTITQTGTGTAIVNALARDPGGLSVQQSITVVAGSEVTPAAVQPGPEPPEPDQPRRTQLAAPAAEEAGAPVRTAAAAGAPDPFPPRLLVAFAASTGYTLARGQGHVSAGYLGASPLAHLGEFGDVLPVAGQASYGLTDDLTLTAGSGFVYYDALGGDSDLFPYVAPRFRVWNSRQISVAVGGYAGLLLADETLTYYAGSIAGSIALDGGLRLHASGGVTGVAATILGETQTDQFGVFAAGGDFRVTPALALAGEFRRVGVEDGSNIVTAGLRFLPTAIAVEAGVAYYLEDGAEVRPIVSMAYRF